MKAIPARRAGAALVVTVCLLGPVLLALLQRVPNVAEQPLTEPLPTWTSEPVPIPGISYLAVGGAYSIHRLMLFTRDAGSMVAHREIRLFVATFASNSQLDHAELTFTGTPCVYRSRPGAEFPNNDLLTFVRDAGCIPLRGTPNGAIELTIRLRNNVSQLGVWTYVTRDIPSASGALFAFRLPIPTEPAYLVRGRLVDVFENGGRRRVELLAYVWQVANGTMWIWLAVCVSALLLSCGTFGFWVVPEHSHRPTVEAAVRAASGFAIAAALSVLYAVLTPPFQAADEPNHFVGFAAFIGQPRLQLEAAHWARLSHFERIQFHPHERFRTSDIGVPGREWDDGRVPDAALRGGGIHWLWWPLGPFLRNLPAPRVLLALRITDAMVFSLTVAFFVVAAVLSNGTRAAHWLALPFFIVPSLPFFGMNVSNHSLLLSADIVIAAGALLLFLDGKGSAVAGLLLGVGWAAAIGISRSAIPLAPFIGTLLMARLLLGSRDGGFTSALKFWSGVTVPPVLVLLTVQPEYLEWLLRYGTYVIRMDWERVMDLVRRRGWILIGAAPVAAAAECGIAWMTRRIEPRLRAVGRKSVALGAAAGAAVVAAAMASSVWWAFPVLPPIDPAHPPPVTDYVASALRAGLTILRITRPDHLTSATFWAGFGWLDTLPDERVISLLAGATGLALIALLIRISRTRDVRRGLLLAFALAGYALSLGAYALVVISATPADLHGRYLAGLYLSMLLISWSPLPMVLSGKRPRPEWTTIACGLSCAAIHAYSLRLLLFRYF